MGGRELAARLRAVSPAVPVVLASGFGEDAAEASAEAARFRQKPFTQAQLTSVVRDALAAPLAAQPQS